MVRRFLEALVLIVSTRRQFLRQGAALTGALLLDFEAGATAGAAAGTVTPMTPRAARDLKLPLRTLKSSEADALSVLGETLLPGSVKAGLVHYVDHQLTVPASMSMFMAKYVGVAPPYLDFYRGGLAAIEALAQRRYAKSTASLDATAAHALVSSLSAGNIPDWKGPPAPLLYFVLRSDTVDVSYGTRAGFERVGVPYMAHIEPSAPWGA